MKAKEEYVDGEVRCSCGNRSEFNTPKDKLPNYCDMCGKKLIAIMKDGEYDD